MFRQLSIQISAMDRRVDRRLKLQYPAITTPIRRYKRTALGSYSLYRDGFPVSFAILLVEDLLRESRLLLACSRPGYGLSRDVYRPGRRGSVGRWQSFVVLEVKC